MTLVESTSLLQAIASLVTLGVVVWYTFETRRIRLDANAQNKLIAEQLFLTRQAFEFERHRETQSNRPLFSWEAISCVENEVHFRFVNQGEVVSNAKVIINDGLEGRIEPKDAIVTGQKAFVKIRWPKDQQRPKTLNFSVEFRDKLNELRKENFKMESHPWGDFRFPELV